MSDLQVGYLASLIDPMPGKIAVQIKAAEEISKGGLYLPADSTRSVHDQKAVQGVVVAIGEAEDAIPEYTCLTCRQILTGNVEWDKHEQETGHKEAEVEHPLKFGIGDTVVFGKYSGTELSYQAPAPEGNELLPLSERKPRPPKERVLIMMYKDILAVIRDPEKASSIKVKG